MGGAARSKQTRTRKRVVHRDSISVRREGAAQVALVGPPNAGKSSLLQALSEIQIKTGDYAFTTTRPVPAVTPIEGVLVQLVEIPGLIEGAAEDRGGGRALLGVLRGADAIVFCQDASARVDELRVVRGEVESAGIEKPALLVATKADEAEPDAFELLRAAFPDLEVLPCPSSTTRASTGSAARSGTSTGLIRVFLRSGSAADDKPIALEAPATVAGVARAIHHELEEECRGARIWGPSARFDGQRVGRDHEVADGDAVEILTRN